MTAAAPRPTVSPQRLEEIRGHVARKHAPWTEHQMLEALLDLLAARDAALAHITQLWAAFTREHTTPRRRGTEGRHEAAV